MRGWPHTSTYEGRGFSVVDMERVPELDTEQAFKCLVEPLEPEQIENLSLEMEQPKLRISWPPISGHVIEHGDKVTFNGEPYEIKKILSDIYRRRRPYFTAILCGGKE